MSQLKPCPFCGKEVAVHERKDFGITYVLCECGACTSFRDFEDKAETVKKWNTRKSEVKKNDR